MTTEVYKFRGAVVGGFNRRDVTEYIQRTAGEHQEQVKELTGKLEQTEQEKAAMAATLEGLQSQSGDLADQEAKVRASLEESTRSLTRLRGELQVTQGQLTMAKKELSDLQAKVAQLEPLAQRYEALKDRIATVELDAHRKAQTTVDEAQRQAEQIREEAKLWLAKFSDSYEALREEVRTCARQAEETRRTFEEQEASYQALLSRSGLSGSREEESRL